MEQVRVHGCRAAYRGLLPDALLDALEVTGQRVAELAAARLPHPLQVLWTLEGNARARAFYERRSVTADGARKVRYLRSRPWTAPGTGSTV